MRFTRLIPIVLIGAVAAQSGKDTILAAFNNINGKINELTGHIGKVASAADVAHLTAASQEVTKALTAGAKAASAVTPNLTLTEAIPIGEKALALSNNAAKAIDSLIEKKPILIGSKATVVGELKAQLAATEAFSNAVLSKVPAEAAAIGKQATSKATTAINKGLAAFA